MFVMQTRLKDTVESFLKLSFELTFQIFISVKLINHFNQYLLIDCGCLWRVYSIQSKRIFSPFYRETVQKFIAIRSIISHDELFSKDDFITFPLNFSSSCFIIKRFFDPLKLNCGLEISSVYDDRAVSFYCCFLLRIEVS